MPMHLLFFLRMSSFAMIGRCRLTMFTIRIIMSKTS
ncbi:hypothetical protein LINPERPRIM_LOCUS34046 [Linum perenne]